MKNAAKPLLTTLSIGVPQLLSGALITESVFSWPGIGQLSYQAATTRDYSLLLGITLFLAVITLLANLIADLAVSRRRPQNKDFPMTATATTSRFDAHHASDGGNAQEGNMGVRGALLTSWLFRIGVGVCLLIVLLCLIAPLITRFSPNQIDLHAIERGPSSHAYPGNRPVGQGCVLSVAVRGQDVTAGGHLRLGTADGHRRDHRIDGGAFRRKSRYGADENHRNIPMLPLLRDSDSSGGHGRCECLERCAHHRFPAMDESVAPGSG
jgi:hypothetical protein